MWCYNFYIYFIQKMKHFHQLKTLLFYYFVIKNSYFFVSSLLQRGVTATVQQMLRHFIAVLLKTQTRMSLNL